MGLVLVVLFSSCDSALGVLFSGGRVLGGCRGSPARRVSSLTRHTLLATHPAGVCVMGLEAGGLLLLMTLFALMLVLAFVIG